MSYLPANLRLMAEDAAGAAKWFLYRSTDPIATALAPGYIADADLHAMNVGDLVLVQEVATHDYQWCVVAARLNGAADLADQLQPPVGLAPLQSPALVGTPTTPTPGMADATRKIATTEWVQAQAYLRGNQRITLSGDSVGSGTTAIKVEVAGLRGHPVAAADPLDGQVLTWSNNVWMPAEGTPGPQGEQGVPGDPGPIGPEGPPSVGSVHGVRITAVSATLNNAVANGAVLQFDTVTNDTDGYAPAASPFDHLTIPAGLGGVYILSAWSSGSGNQATTLGMGILINGTQVFSETNQSITGPASINYTLDNGAVDIGRLSPGDTVQLRNNSVSAGTNVFRSTTLSLFRIEPAGVDGPTGPQGPQGLTGPAGPTGPQGPTGTAGAGGASGQVQINAAGSLGGVTMAGDATWNTATGALALAAVNAAPGSYTNTNLTVDAKGRITAAANGAAGGSIPVPLTVPLGGTGATNLPLSPVMGAVGGPTGTMMLGAGTAAAATSPYWSVWGDTGLTGYAASATDEPYLDLGRALGTPGSPASVTNGTTLGSLYFDGYGAGWATGAISYVIASENWTATAKGAQFRFGTNTLGTTTLVQRLSIGPGVVAGTPTGGDLGAGTVNATGLYINGTAALTGNQTITLSGDATGSGTTALPVTLATVNSNVGTYQGITVNGKGLVTAAADQGYLTVASAAATYAPLAGPVFTGDPRAPTPSPGDNDTSVATTAFVGAAITAAPNKTITLSGDISGTGTAAITTTLPNVNSNVGVFVATTLNAKGQVTAGGNLTGDVTTSGAAATIANSAVTLAKMQNRAASTLLGNPTGSAAAPSEITLGTNLSFAGSVLNATAGAGGLSGMTAGQIPIAATATTVTSSANLSGDVVSTATTLATTIQANAVTTTKILNANVTYAKIQNVANNRLLGNTSGSAAAPSEIVLPLAVANGGTNAATAAAALTSLGAAPLDTPVFTGLVTSGSGAASGLSFYDRTVGTTRWTFSATGGSFNFNNSVNGNVAVIDNGGNLTLSSILVAGATGGNKGAGTINAQAVYANNVLLTSDARLKRDIEPLPDCLGLVEAIEPKRFRWASTAPEKTVPPGFYERPRWGFLAQDIAAAIGAAVEEDADGIQSYDPAAMTACLWRAVQELAARVAELEGRAGGTGSAGRASPPA